MFFEANISVDPKLLKKEAGIDNVEEAIAREFGWLESSGIFFKSIKPVEELHFYKKQNAKRISKDDYYLNIAKSALERSTCLRRHYGAVIVKNDTIISTGYNGSARGDENCIDIGICERQRLNIPPGERYELCVSVHAEANAIIAADRDKMINSTMYIVGRETTTNDYADPSPCIMCRRLIINAGIKKVIGLIDDRAQEIIL